MRFRMAALCFGVSLCFAHADAATLLAGYDMDTNNGTAAGAAVLDVSGLATPLDAVIQPSSSVVADNTRPNAAAGNQVLSVGVTGLGAFSPYDARLDTGTDGFTFVAWVKHSNSANFQSVVGRGPFAERIFNDFGGYPIAISNGTNNPGGFQFLGTGTSDNADGEWHHVAVSLDLSDPLDPRIKGYQDGMLVANNPTDIPGLNPISNGIDIAGRQFDNGDAFPNSMLDDVAMFRGALSDSDVSALYSGAKSLADFAIPEPSAALLALTPAVVFATRRRWRAA
ncbi:LamG-like jellyroll fold domain-containing protein [Botrimarina sp.]|uniref:LamG-like jellyroll fold domain-containing protein n=1 Tax=Botrimarina sp. TaxID=2795802 RepID=UPI0032EC1CC3